MFLALVDRGAEASRNQARKVLTTRALTTRALTTRALTTLLRRACGGGAVRRRVLLSCALARLVSCVVSAARV
jgi:hypothetical protein